MAGYHGQSIRFPAPGSLRRKQMLLLACWLIEGIVCVLFVRHNGGFIVPSMEAEPGTAKPTLGNNETGPSYIQRLAADGSGGPAFYLGWRNMRMEGGRAGVFSTPLHKTLEIEGLVLRIHCDSQAAEDPDNRAVFAQTMRGLKGPDFAGLKIRSPLQEVNRATQIIVRSLDYRVFRDGCLDLSIQCRHAVISTSGMEATLRGGVTIRATDGSKLMSNCVVWDVEKNHFFAAGAYVLGRDGISVAGQGIRCDHRLNVSFAREVRGRKGESR